ncbi:MAG: septation protein SpoVG family protein [Ruminococcus sp.]|nr:septation protein SpoVG family protein [Ruminococcus sp.]
MEITSIRTRQINSNNLLAIASVTLDDEIIINDIKVFFSDGVISIVYPNTERAKQLKQKNIIVNNDLHNKIKLAIIEQINQT